jgi:MFS family permease
MLVAIATLSAGYFLGGAIGDFAFRRTPRGRALTSTVGVLAGAVLLVLTLNVQETDRGSFMVLLGLTGVMMSMAAPNVVAIIHDVTEPEVRGTAQAIQYFAENIGSAIAPWLAGLIAVQYSLHVAILVLCVSTWILCGLLFGATAIIVPRDIARLREILRERAETGIAAG